MPATVASPATVAPPPAVSGAASFAVFFLTVLGPAFSFDENLHPWSVVLNSALVIAAIIVFLEITELLIKLTDYGMQMMNAIKIALIGISAFLLYIAFVLFSINKGIAGSLLFDNVILGLPPSGFIIFIWFCRPHFVFTPLLNDLKNTNFLLTVQWIWKKLTEAVEWVLGFFSIHVLGLVVINLIVVHVAILIAIIIWIRQGCSISCLTVRLGGGKKVYVWLLNGTILIGSKDPAKRSSVKLYTYRKFSNAFIITVVLSVIWIGYEVYFKATNPFNERWQTDWIITAFWDILAFALLCVICYLWAPPLSSQRFIY